MLRQISASTDRHRLNAPFRISRGVKTEIEVVTAEVRAGARTARGEGVPYPRYGETPEGVLAQVLEMQGAVAAGLGRRELLERMPAGSARNAIDCALWSLEAGDAAAEPAAPVVTALTISLDAPEKMAAAAERSAEAPLLKVKVDAFDPEAQVRAVRAAAPRARLIVDPNESWSFALLRELQPLLAELRVDLLEQPLPADDDEALEGFSPQVPICADEACHVAADLARVGGRYQAVNIKLDKAGGLTAALDLRREAKRRGMSVMVGCMVCTSLSIAPAVLLAADAAFVDLDGPFWLADDHSGGATFEQGVMRPPSPRLWNPAASKAALHNSGL